MKRVLISDTLSPCGVEILENAEGIQVDVITGLAPEALRSDLASLPLTDYTLEVFEETRRGFRGRRVRIEVTGVCTRCHADEFFSYRASGGKTGRFALLVGLTAETDDLCGHEVLEGQIQYPLGILRQAARDGCHGCGVYALEHGL